jgi:hypothetical protein
VINKTRVPEALLPLLPLLEQHFGDQSEEITFPPQAYDAMGAVSAA